MKLKYSEIFSLIIGGGVIIFLLINFYITKPIVESIFDANSKIKEANAKILEIEHEKTVNENLKANKQKIESAYFKIANFLPNNLDSGNFIIELDKLAKDNNQVQNEILITKPAATVSTDEENASNGTVKELSENNFIVTQNGNLSNFISFMQSLEKNGRFFTPIDITISANNDGTIVSKLTGTIYYKNALSPANIVSNLSKADEVSGKIDSFLKKINK